MIKTLKADKVFISYSWAMQGREEWILDLANRLTNDGVEVILDKWDSKEGQNLNEFMQRCVNDPTIQKVLVICDKVYTSKANGFEGGVGTETVIISDEVYRDVKQTKFIPIIAERGSDGEEFIPTYLKGTKYIDMSSGQGYEEGYEKLIRNLYHKPEYVRPEIGSPPIHLLKDEKKTNLLSEHALKRFQHLAEKRPNKVNIYVNDFYDAFKKDYMSYAIKDVERDKLAEQVYTTFHEMKELMTIYVDFLDTYIKEADELNTQKIVDLFELLYPLIETRSDSNSYFESQFDHMKLFITELVIYTVSILFRYEYYSEIKNLIKNHYFVIDGLGRELDGSIGLFRSYPRLLEEFQPNSGGTKYISYSGNLIIQRDDIKNIISSDLIQADFLLYMLSFTFGKSHGYDEWYPPTMPYFTNEKLKFLTRLKSKSYFDSIKVLFDVTNVSEMKVLVEKFQKHYSESRRRSFNGYVLFINPEEIAMY